MKSNATIATEWTLCYKNFKDVITNTKIDIYVLAKSYTECSITSMYNMDTFKIRKLFFQMGLRF